MYAITKIVCRKASAIGRVIMCFQLIVSCQIWSAVTHGSFKLERGLACIKYAFTNNTFHGANMGPTWVLSAPCWPHEPCYQGCANPHSVLLSCVNVEIWRGVRSTINISSTQGLGEESWRYLCFHSFYGEYVLNTIFSEINSFLSHGSRTNREVTAELRLFLWMWILSGKKLKSSKREMNLIKFPATKEILMHLMMIECFGGQKPRTIRKISVVKIIFIGDIKNLLVYMLCIW